jgi:hypothetical protein
MSTMSDQNNEIVQGDVSVLGAASGEAGALRPQDVHEATNSSLEAYLAAKARSLNRLDHSRSIGK